MKTMIAKGAVGISAELCFFLALYVSDLPTFLCSCMTNVFKLSGLLMSAKTLWNAVPVGPCFHSWGWFREQTFKLPHKRTKKKRVNDACYSEKTTPWWTETESTFELLPSGGQTVQAFPHCEDSLPYISTTSGSQRQSAEYLWRRICQIDLSLYLGLVWFVSPRAVVIPRKRRSRVIICKAADFRNWI